MEQSLEQFKAAQKNKAGCPNKIRNSWGVYDYYKFYRKDKPKEPKYVLTESQYFAIIRKVNKLLLEELMRVGELEFPYRMGKIVVRERPVVTKIKDGNLITTRRVDWDKTLNLWYEDPNSYKNRVLVRQEGDSQIATKYIKDNAIFKNKQYYDFALNRELAKVLCMAVRTGTLELQSTLKTSEFGNINKLYNDQY